MCNVLTFEMLAQVSPVQPNIDESAMLVNFKNILTVLLCQKKKKVMCEMLVYT